MKRMIYSALLAIVLPVAIVNAATAQTQPDPNDDVTCMSTFCTDGYVTKTPRVDPPVQSLSITADVTRTATCNTPSGYDDIRASFYYDRNAAGTAYKMIGFRAAPIASSNPSAVMTGQDVLDAKSGGQTYGHWEMAMVGATVETFLTGGLWTNSDNRFASAILYGPWGSCSANVWL